MAVTLNSATDQVNYGDLAFIGGATELSISFIFKPSTLTTSDMICSQWASGSFTVAIIDSNELRFIVSNDGTFSTFFGRKTTDLNMTTGTEYRVVLTWSPGSIAVYVNGSEYTTTNQFAGTCNSLFNSTEDVTLGYRGDAAADGTEGDLSEFAIWTRELTEGEALAITGSDQHAPDWYHEGLELYDRLLTTSSYDRKGGVTPTHTSTATATHPAVNYGPVKMILPDGQIFMTGAATYTEQAAGGGGLPKINGITSYTALNGISSFTSINGVT